MNPRVNRVDFSIILDKIKALSLKKAQLALHRIFTFKNTRGVQKWQENLKFTRIKRVNSDLG